MKKRKEEKLFSMVEKFGKEITDLVDWYEALDIDLDQQELRRLNLLHRNMVKKFLISYSTVYNMKLPLQGGYPKDLEARRLAKLIVDKYVSEKNKLPTGTYLFETYNQTVREMALQRQKCPDEIAKRTCELWLKEMRDNNFSYEGEPTEF
jgi:hypothetical protein